MGGDSHLGGDDFDQAFKPIIPQQTTYPCQSGVLGYTIRTNQEHDGTLDLPAADALIRSDEAKTKIVQIKSG